MFRYVIWILGIGALALILWPAIVRGMKAVDKAAKEVNKEPSPHVHEEPKDDRVEKEDR